MSIMHFDAMGAAAAGGFTVSLGGGWADDATGFLEAYAGWQTRADGTMWKNEGGSLTQNRPLTDWITPRGGSFDATDYEIRMNSTGGGPTTGPGTNVWLGMNTFNTWEWRCNRFCVQSFTITFDIRHATDGSKNTVSSLHDSAACMATSNGYTVTIEAT